MRAKECAIRNETFVYTYLRQSNYTQEKQREWYQLQGSCGERLQFQAGKSLLSHSQDQCSTMAGVRYQRTQFEDPQPHQYCSAQQLHSSKKKYKERNSKSNKKTRKKIKVKSKIIQTKKRGVCVVQEVQEATSTDDASVVRAFSKGTRERNNLDHLCHCVVFVNE